MGWVRRGRKGRWWALLAVVLAASTLIAGVPSAHAARPSDPAEPDPIPPGESEAEPWTPPENGFDWSVPSRFGRDKDGDRIIDYHWNALGEPRKHAGPYETYAEEWVHPSAFPMDFDGCPTESEAKRSDTGEPTENTYTWTVAGVAGEGRQSCRFHRHVFSAQGDYQVALTITRPDGNASTVTQDVFVRDILIVSLGDSYGSGEGNPDIPQRVDHSGLPSVESPARWVDERCHRSAYAGPARAALMLEAADPKTSVTFLSFACSGATINTAWGSNPIYPYAPADPDPAKNSGTGVLGPYNGVAPPAGAPKLPSQLDQLHDAVRAPGGDGFRTVDALIMSAGGNDAGFAPVAAQCVLVIEECMGSHVQRRGGGWNDNVRLDERFQQDLAGLTEAYAALDSELDEYPVPILQKYVSEYPDSTTGDGVETCSAILDDVLHPNPLAIAAAMNLLSAVFGPYHFAGSLAAALFLQTRGMHGEEVAWARRTIASGINAHLRVAAHQFGWTYVGGISERFDGHGYCASDPFIRRAPESSRVQGPWGPLEVAGIHFDTKGTLHPNVAGHRVYAEQLYARLAPQFGLAPSDSSGFTHSDELGGTVSRRGQRGWLTGRCTKDTNDCRSDYAVATVEVTDAVGLKGARLNVNGSRECPAEIRCQATKVSDSIYRWEFTFPTEGIWDLDFMVTNRRGHVATFAKQVKVDLNDPTAVATGARGAVPTGVRFESLDGRGSGVDVVRFEGLSYGSPGLASPGQVIPVDLGGVYELRYQAVDEAGRTGPWQTQTLKLAGPTMSAPADVWQSCTQFPQDDGGASNQNDGRAVMWSNDRSRVLAVPSGLALSLASKATWTADGAWAPGHEDCEASADFRGVPVTIDPGTSGLAPGTPVTVTATVRLSGGLVEDYELSDPDFILTADSSMYLRVNPATDEPPCDWPCRRVAPVEFYADAYRQIYATRGYLKSGYRELSYSLSSNRDPRQSEWVDDAYDECVWPCGGGAGASPASSPLRFPKDTLTITFDTKVGARHLIDGGIRSFTQAYSDGRTPVSASVDFTPALELAPAQGFEGVRLAYGDGWYDPNEPPLATDDALATDEDVAGGVDVLANDVDVDGDALSVVAVSDPAHGTATVSAEGGVVYVPDADYAGADSFTYEVSDGKRTATGTVAVTVRPVNDAPRPAEDSVQTAEDTAAAIRPLANDVEVDGEALRLVSVTDPARGGVVVGPNGGVVYTPDADLAGEDAFTYVVEDGAGTLATGTVRIMVSPVNDTPSAQDDADATDESVPVVLDVLANDTDVDGDALMVASVSDPAHGTAVVTVDGMIEYRPDEGYLGTDTFHYTASDGALGDTATVRITVRPRTVSIQDMSVIEGHDAKTAAFAVTLSSPSPSPVTVAFRVEHGTAGLFDVLATAGVVTIPAGEHSGDASVVVVGDRVREPAEAFTVTLTEPSGAVLGRAQARGTIVDDD